MRTHRLNALAICVLVSLLGLGSQASGQSGIITTVAGPGVPGAAAFAGDGGPATSASLWYPNGVAVDASRNLFIVDFNNYRVRKVSANGIITTVAGDGQAGLSGSDYAGPATSASFTPHGVAADASGNLYIADGNFRIRKVSASGIMTTFAGGGNQPVSFGGDGGPAISASLSGTSGVTLDASGNLFIADSGNHRIRKVSVSGIITTVAGNGVQGFSGDRGPATSASLNMPQGVAVDASGNLFIMDTYNYRVRKVSASGIITTVAGNGVLGFSGDGGPAISASLSPTGFSGVAVDASGNLFIADAGNDRIRKVSASGIITTVAGGGPGLGDGGPATSASLYQPDGVAVDASGNLFIADTFNNRIREVSAAPAPSGSPVAIALPAAVNTVDANPNTNQVYVGGNISNVVQNIVWIDGNTNTIVKSLGVGQGLHVNPATNKIYAADLYAGHILVYSGSDGSLLNTISAFGCPVEVVVDSSLNHIWGSGQCGGGNDPAFLINGSTNTLISGYVGSGGVMGGAMAVNPATHALYMSVGGVEKEVNASTFAVTTAPFSASVVASNLLAASMYGADSSGKNVVVINYGTESVVATLPVTQTGAIAVNPTRNRVYAVDLSVSPPVIKVFAGGNSLSGSNTLIGSIPLRSGDHPCCSMAVNSSSGKIYLPVVNSGSPFLLVIDDTLTSNPPVSAPVLTSLSPSTAVAGAGALTVTVNGAGFVSGSLVQWNGAALTTTFVSATQLTAAVPASDIASVGVAQVTVTNPGGGTSNALPFTIQASVGAVSITSIAPSSATAGGGAFTLTVNGTGFVPSFNSLQGPVPGSVVQWNGTALQTTLISSTQLTAAVPAGDLASAGTAQVTVANGASTTSNALPFTITQTVSSYTGCNGQPATGNLQLWIMSLNTITGVVQINGVVSGASNTPFTWIWGDSAATQGFFPQSHTYSNVQLNYSLQVTSHENDGSTDCAQLSIIFNAQTTGSITSVTTAYAGAVIAQDDFIVIKGANLVPANTPATGAIWSTAPSFASGLMPTQLGGVSVTVNNKPAFVYFYCSAATDPACLQDQLNILTPLDNATGPVPVVVTSGGISSPPFTANMQPVAPSLLLASTAGYVVATHANSSPVGPTSLYPGSSTPATPGEPIALYAIGLGLPTTPLVNGSASQSGSLPALPVCKVGGSAATVTYAALISPGLYQLNLTIPATAANGDNAVGCTYNGATTPAGDLITVQSSTPNPTLTITKSGTGSGTVSAFPAGTSCGSGCLSFAAGTVATLTATPNTGSAFAGWSGACSGTASCSVTMNSNQAVTAAFNLASGNSITIISVSSASLTPLTPLQISASGIDMSAPIQVQFLSSSGFSATEQPIRVGSDGTIVAAVPIYIDPNTEQIGQGAVSLVLTQGSQSSAPMTVSIQNLPPLSTYGTQLGQVSHAVLVFDAIVLARRLNQFQAFQVLSGNTVDTSAAQSTLRTLLNAVIQARSDVDRVMLDNTVVIDGGNLPDGTPVQFDKNSLDMMDRISAIFLFQTLATLPPPPSSSNAFAPSARVGPDFATLSDLRVLLQTMTTLKGGAGIVGSLQGAANAGSANNSLDAALAVIGGVGVFAGHLPLGLERELLGAAAGAVADARVMGDAYGDLAGFAVGLASGNQALVDAAVTDLNSIPTFKLIKAASDLLQLLPVASLVRLGAEARVAGKVISTTLNLIDVVNDYFADDQAASGKIADLTGAYRNPFPSRKQGIAEITGSVSVPNGQGPAAAQSGLDLCCFGAGSLGMIGIADPSGDYELFVPLGAPGFDYSKANLQVVDPITQTMLGSELLDLSGLTTIAPMQVATISVSPPGGGLTGTWTGSFTENAGGCPFAGTMSWSLTETGTTLTGTLTYNGTIQSTIPQLIATCGSTTSVTDTLHGSVNGNAITLTADGGGETFTATVNGTTIAGTGLYKGQYYNITWNCNSLTKH